MTFGRTARAARSDTCRQNLDDADSRRNGRQPEAAEDGEVGGVWMDKNVEVPEEEEETRQYHRHTASGGRRHRPPRVAIQCLGKRRSMN